MAMFLLNGLAVLALVLWIVIGGVFGKYCHDLLCPIMVLIAGLGIWLYLLIVIATGNGLDFLQMFINCLS